MQNARGDPSPRALLRKLSFCAQCLRGAKSKRLFASGILHNAPPIFFSSCRKEDGPRLGQKKRALNALNLCTATDPVIAIVGHFRLSGRNR